MICVLRSLDGLDQSPDERQPEGRSVYTAEPAGKGARETPLSRLKFTKKLTDVVRAAGVGTRRRVVVSLNLPRLFPMAAVSARPSCH